MQTPGKERLVSKNFPHTKDLGHRFASMIQSANLNRALGHFYAPPTAVFVCVQRGGFALPQSVETLRV